MSVEVWFVFVGVLVGWVGVWRFFFFQGEDGMRVRTVAGVRGWGLVILSGGEGRCHCQGGREGGSVGGEGRARWSGEDEKKNGQGRGEEGGVGEERRTAR